MRVDILHSCEWISLCVLRSILGANLKDLVCGSIRLAFVSNFMVDMQWLITGDLNDVAQAVPHIM